MKRELTQIFKDTLIPCLKHIHFFFLNFTVITLVQMPSGLLIDFLTKFLLGHRQVTFPTMLLSSRHFPIHPNF